ncbi:lipoprotein [Pseudomonas oryzihabitans]|uniref:YajG family lipoprotein n=1 Tax=Pseudomonas rhizoryzae TaxID=2571129 RepID=UPI000736357A|nr:YajG family lipoprotein [Pseudomonas rhizoryzae]KTS72444.1 lipoprotein [Pseudomonas psychrotolerans]KTT04243.1 lipoprotein [Pseudomonas psychrotolerans]KTT21372.1 lipoprotein [Pseudomonas psychrotolerans]KTT41550.1 lipoprotein [Pseudomonas psychrotolerans]KTT46544.1 lipoprotein [Pseudomonas psychrotolerans]
MRYRLLLGLLAAAGLTLVGCASSPQQLSPQPQLTAPIAPVGQGQPVMVRVVDGRSSFTLGTRGGLYPDTSVVVVPTQNVLPQLQAAADKAVREMGFTPSPNAGPGVPRLTLTLADLSYQSPKELYVTSSNVGATFQVDVGNSQRSYRGRYSASLDQRFGMAPNAEANTKLVSDVLSDALTRVFKDPTVVQVLSGH